MKMRTLGTLSVLSFFIRLVSALSRRNKRTGNVLFALLTSLLLFSFSSAYAAYDYTTVFVPGSDNTKARGINNAGMVVGLYTSGGSWYGFTFDGTGCLFGRLCSKYNNLDKGSLDIYQPDAVIENAEEQTMSQNE